MLGSRYGAHTGRLVGDVLLAAAFVSYAGPFTIPFRRQLATDKWLPDLIERSIPMTTGVQVLDFISSDIAKASACPSHMISKCVWLLQSPKSWQQCLPVSCVSLPISLNQGIHATLQLMCVRFSGDLGY